MRHLNDSTISQLGITISDVKDASIISDVYRISQSRSVL